MKPEVQPKRLKTPPIEAIPEEPPFLSAEGFRRNRSLFLGIGAALAVVLLAMAGVGIRSYLVASANTKGWETYATTRANLSFAAPPAANAPKGPEDSVRDIEAALPSIRNTSAEPWVLFDLGNAYFASGDAQKARDVFVDLKTRFKDHVLVNKDSSYHMVSKVDAAIEDCDSELAWSKEHPRPRPKPPATSGAGSGGNAPGPPSGAPGSQLPGATDKK
ncbi:MAG: hypothetical protein HYR85_05605 [Planctomycetes bacterium]|nr:hypothetical protein [Planctomycetota bacterium]MBI3848276.1 hypothetical protein [Planctomycetota bacterium]